MGIRQIVDQFIALDYPDLARRINALLWAYERGNLRYRIQHEPLGRRKRKADDSSSPARQPSGDPLAQVGVDVDASIARNQS